MENIFCVNINSLHFEPFIREFAFVLPQSALQVTERYRNQQDQLRHIVGEVLSRYAISKRLGILYASQFDLSVHGKPYIKESEIHFNISHAKEFVVVAIGDDPLGIDVEYLRKDKRHVAEKYFSEQEKYEISISLDPDSEFTRLWSLKEAYVKCIGVGITQSLNSFSVVHNRDNRYVIWEEGRRVGAYTLFSYQLTDDYFLSLCCSRAEETAPIIERVTHESLHTVLYKIKT